ncbi:MAG: hypothetical protein HYR94_20405 [Chloroflexi bacterium]|nr:hypothetical protein [Chloroflexota bacterium]
MNTEINKHSRYNFIVNVLDGSFFGYLLDLSCRRAGDCPGFANSRAQPVSETLLGDRAAIVTGLAKV